MLFNSFAFALFFPLVTLVYFSLKPQLRWSWLLLASSFFYAFFIPEYLLILFALILLDFGTGLWIEGVRPEAKRAVLGVSLAANLGLLFVFKYFDFFSVNLASSLQFFGINITPPLLEMVLPLGLSFHTFQSMAYTIEVYRGRQRAERHLGYYALYVLFYPQLVAGPIERPQNLLAQFRIAHTVDYDRVVSGLKLMATGLIKKMVIADRIAVVVNEVYQRPGDYDGYSLTIATWLFAFQIYGDFSGYTDIARGAARVMGYELMQNFDHPYSSTSVAEFWRRWHISLSSWFRDYVYHPLGGNRCSTTRHVGNLFAVFLLSGLWHGASWNFVIWGGLHGLYVSAGRLLRPSNWGGSPAITRALDVFITFNLVSIAWVFFRAVSLSDAVNVLMGIGRYLTGMQPPGLKTVFVPVYCFALVAVWMLAEFLQRRADVWRTVGEWPAWARWPVYYACVAAILLLGSTGRAQFLYFQF